MKKKTRKRKTMKREFLAVLTAMAVLLAVPMTAFASSPTVGTTEAPVKTQKAITAMAATQTPAEYLEKTTVSGGYKVSAVSDTTVQSAAVAVQNAILNNVESIASKIGDKTLASAAKKSGSQVIASIITVVDVSATSASKDVNGRYVITLKAPGIAAGDAVVVLHYTGGAWETIIPTKVGNGYVTFRTASLSPFVVVKLSAATVSRAPKTGAAMPVAAVFLGIGVAGTAVCGKKYFI